ncbi:glycosyltransferase family 4 protein [Vallicoccus soli]|uniref:Glycosyltransferase family 1 protein n=1 Tax=Vallicoccus soli TaxID=2339232 RepID=A0A3A3ZKG4_9ACTN|nr:glycosyltransferase family 4 protein [Vallicoccus soli]RJK96330.1 glycosyltransferase family 1 protein [Vallicoccus soli]
MRVCFVSRRYWPAVSGMSVYAEQLLAQLAARGHEVVLVSQFRGDPDGVAVYGGGPPPAERVPAGVRAVPVEAVGEQRVADGHDADFDADITAVADVVERLHAERPFDVLHAQYGWPTGMAVLEASARTGVPSVVSIQGGDGHWVGLCCDRHGHGIRTVLAHAGRLLIGSASFAEEVAANHGTPLERFDVLGGATDTTAFAPAPGRAPGDLQDPPVLLFHGRVDRRKGVLDAVRAVAALRDAGRPVRLVVSGIGPDVRAVDDLVAELGLQDLVDQLGYVAHDKAPEVYAAADAFLSPTESEGFSNTILEAMATGLPVVSTRSVGVVDCVRDGENGLLVPVHDVPALTAAVERLLADGPLRRRLAACALQEVRTRWAWPVLAGRVEAAYGELAGTVPDLSWRDVAAPDADAACRFLRAPHLL